MEGLMNLPWYIYIMLGVFVVFFVIQKVLPTLKKGKEVVERGKQIFSNYITNPAGSTLSDDELKAISVGAINGEQTSCYIDSLTTGMKAGRLSEGLEGSWGITDATSAKETLNWLKSEGHRVYFPKIYSIEKEVNKEAWQSAIETNFEGEDQEKALEYLTNFSETKEDLQSQDGMLDSDFAKGILAWDMGRMVILARMSFDAGHLDEAEAWSYINSALKQSKGEFANWKELGKSYIIGRAMWSGNDMMLSGLKNIASSLSTDAKSPWNKISLN